MAGIIRRRHSSKQSTQNVGMVTNGLIRWWDAIENTPTGHQTSPDAWTDRIGHLAPSKLNNPTFSDTYLIGGDTYQSYGLPGNAIAPYADAWTVEAIVKAPSVLDVNKEYSFPIRDSYTENPGTYRWNAGVTTVSNLSVGHRLFFWYNDGTPHMLSMGNEGNITLGGDNILSITFDRPTLKFYVNGVLCGTQTMPSSYHMPSLDDAIFCYILALLHDGKWDRVYSCRVYNRALSGLEILKNMQFANNYYNLQMAPN